MKTYKYALVPNKEVASKVLDQNSWMIEKMNEVGAQGIRVVSMAMGHEPSPFSDAASGKPIPYLSLNLVTEVEVESAPEEVSSDPVGGAA